MTEDEKQIRQLCSDLAKLNPINQFVIKVQAEALLTSQRLEENRDERREKEGSADKCTEGTPS